MIDKIKFAEWLKLKNLAEITIKEYLYYFSKLEQDKLSSKEYLYTFLSKNNNNLIVRAMLKNLMSYIKANDFPQEIKEFSKEFEIPRMTGRQKLELPEILTMGEVNVIANKTNRRRDELMILLTFYCGLRCEELLNIKLQDINWSHWIEDQKGNGELKVTGKKKQRMVPILRDIMRYMYWWIQDEKPNIKQEDNLFDIGERRWEFILSAVSYRAIGKRINPHLLRHSSASFLRSRGMGIDEIGDFLGHTNLNTTRIYTHINKTDLNRRIGSAFGSG